VARYKLIDHWRRNRIRRHTPLDDVSEWLSEEADDGPAVRADLERVLSVLPEKQRKLVRDVKIEGLSLAEAGRAMGVSEGAAKVSLHRAMKLLTQRNGPLEDR
jgi:RNA polymerase sigma-70 factor (ECF subfamily)